MDVWPSDSVGSVKEAICQSLMVDPSMTMLVFMGKPLEDNTTIAQMAIPENAKLQMMLRYPAGV